MSKGQQMANIQQQADALLANASTTTNQEGAVKAARTSFNSFIMDFRGRSEGSIPVAIEAVNVSIQSAFDRIEQRLQKYAGDTATFTADLENTATVKAAKIKGAVSPL